MGEDYTDAEAKKIKVNGESCGDYWKVNSGQTYEEVPQYKKRCLRGLLRRKLIL